MSRSLWTAAIGLLLVACGSGEDQPRWTRLLSDGGPPSVSYGGEPGTTPAGQPLEVVSDDRETWIEITLRPQDWKRYPLAGSWRAPLGMPLAGHDQRGISPYRLASEERQFEVSPVWELGREQTPPDPNTFVVQGDAVLLFLEKGERPERDVVLGVRLRAIPEGAAPRVRGRRFSGEGLSVWPGESHRYRADLPANASLRFATTLEPLLDQGGDDVVFKVTLEGEILLEHRADPHAEHYAWHELVLPAEGARDAELAFEVRGGPAYASFFAPTLGPAEVGTHDARPWGDTRPDLVLFIADTFRADNLSAYGGEHGAAPQLDRLLERGRVFERAWSVSTYTLPGHASMFAGVYPRQAGINSLSRALPEEITTLTEVLAARGYRCGAITDSGIVSQSFAFDQGFEWFDERHNGMPKTVQRARDFLACDDGRPVFLFVQSYRTHRPYRPDPEVDVDPDTIMSEARALEERLVGVAKGQGQDAKMAWALPDKLTESSELDEVVAGLRDLYLRGVSDLDTGFAQFFAELESRGVLREGLLILTSDHGESFAEHGSLYHGNEVFESETRVPLVLFGDRVEAGRVPWAASLIDLAPTFVAMADVPVRPEWLGSNLLELAEDRAIFSFECDRSDRSTLAIMEGDRKLVGVERGGRFGELIGAFNLTDDPQEAAPLGDEADWPARMLERLGPRAGELTEPIYDPSRASIDARKAAELGDLGYSED